MSRAESAKIRANVAAKSGDVVQPRQMDGLKVRSRAQSLSGTLHNSLGHFLFGIPFVTPLPCRYHED